MLLVFFTVVVVMVLFIMVIMVIMVIMHFKHGIFRDLVVLEILVLEAISEIQAANVAPDGEVCCFPIIHGLSFSAEHPTEAL